MDAKYIRLANQMNGLGDDSQQGYTFANGVDDTLKLAKIIVDAYGKNNPYANTNTSSNTSGSPGTQYIFIPTSTGANTNSNTSSETKSDNTVLYLALGACVACAALFAFSRRR